jgi:hypothetical protein
MELAQKAFHVPYFLKKIGICNISNKVMIQTGCLVLAGFLLCFVLTKQVEELCRLLHYSSITRVLREPGSVGPKNEAD